MASPPPGRYGNHKLPISIKDGKEGEGKPVVVLPFTLSVCAATPMKLLDQMQRRFGRFAMPYVTEGLIACQVLTYFLVWAQPTYVDRIALIPSRVLQGEVWRLATFLCEPPITNPVFAFFAWYMFFLMGMALEGTWGTFRYNVFLLTGYLATVAVSFLQPDQPASIGFLQGSVFLAFAYLFPDFEFLLFLILPVKVKWLALLAWIGYGYAFLFGDWMTRLMVAASVCNFFLFFGHDIYLRMKSGQRRMVEKQPRSRPPTSRGTRAPCPAGRTASATPNWVFAIVPSASAARCYRRDIHNHAASGKGSGMSRLISRWLCDACRRGMGHRLLKYLKMADPGEPCPISGTVPIFVAGRHKNGTVPFGTAIDTENGTTPYFASVCLGRFCGIFW